MANNAAINPTTGPTVTLTSAAGTFPDHTTETFTGTVVSGAGDGIANQLVTLTDNNQPLTTTTTDANGDFSVGATLQSLGTHSVVASAVDGNGITGTSAALVDTLFQTVADLDPISQEVTLLYYSLLDRAADGNTLAKDHQALLQHHTTLNKIASSLLHSHEYSNIPGHQTNAQFVIALYESALGRLVSDSEFSSDVHALNHGMSRHALTVSVAESPEAVAHFSTKPA